MIPYDVAIILFTVITLTLTLYFTLPNAYFKLPLDYYSFKQENKIIPFPINLKIKTCFYGTDNQNRILCPQH